MRVLMSAAQDGIRRKRMDSDRGRSIVRVCSWASGGRGLAREGAISKRVCCCSWCDPS